MTQSLLALLKLQQRPLFGLSNHQISQARRPQSLDGSVEYSVCDCMPPEQP